jgi:uncharacterized protein (DUF305 family)
MQNSMKNVVIILIVIIVVGGGYLLARTIGPAERANEPTAQMPKAGHIGHSDHASLVTDEKSFIAEMIPHHEEAITSSQELLKVTKTPEVRSLAENIIAAQEKEVADMKAWYREWFGEEYAPTGNYKPMMSSIEGKTAEEAEHSYLMEMIVHHEAAVVMAKKILPIAEHEEIKTLGDAIVKTQNQEIETMESLLGEKKEHEGHH